MNGPRLYRCQQDREASALPLGEFLDLESRRLPQEAIQAKIGGHPFPGNLLEIIELKCRLNYMEIIEDTEKHSR